MDAMGESLAHSAIYCGTKEKRLVQPLNQLVHIVGWNLLGQQQETVTCRVGNAKGFKDLDPRIQERGHPGPDKSTNPNHFLEDGTFLPQRLSATTLRLQHEQTDRLCRQLTNQAVRDTIRRTPSQSVGTAPRCWNGAPFTRVINHRRSGPLKSGFPRGRVYSLLHTSKLFIQLPMLQLSQVGKSYSGRKIYAVILYMTERAACILISHPILPSRNPEIRRSRDSRSKTGPKELQKTLKELLLFRTPHGTNPRRRRMGIESSEKACLKIGLPRTLWPHESTCSRQPKLLQYHMTGSMR